ncbi:MAG TPA: Ppx/GppA phosphatase family protein [Micromonosporaceae bacterium]|jgi:exopolyphosphatase/guanosine-5'-triphosphate,3'-diphosphate pyrophosphatase
MARVAAIDCGTNSVRLLVADVPPDGSALVEVLRRMEIVRLGKDVDRTGRLDPAAIERTRVVLAQYAVAISELGAGRVRMVATSATRDASNADEFRKMVLSTLGVAPEVVTGDEEARLSFTGAVQGLPAGAEPPYLVVDIGGGSTEFVLGGSTMDGATTVAHAVSVDIGCVRMTERHLLGDPPTAAQIAGAERDIGAAVDRALTVVAARRAHTLVGLAGSVTTVAALALRLTAYDRDRIHHARIRYGDVSRVTAELLSLTHEQRLALPPMHPGRADVIGAGALVLRIIMEKVGAQAVIASEHDILDGIAAGLRGADSGRATGTLG